MGRVDRSKRPDHRLDPERRLTAVASPTEWGRREHPADKAGAQRRGHTTRRASSSRSKLPDGPLPPSLRSGTLPHCVREGKKKTLEFASPTEWGRREHPANEAGAQQRGQVVRVLSRILDRPHLLDSSSQAAPSATGLPSGRVPPPDGGRDEDIPRLHHAVRRGL